MIYLQLFLSFLQIGAFSFGGGYAAMPLIQEQVVTLHGWLTADTFADLVTIAEMTPGPIAINAATFVGTQVAGVTGAVVATLLPVSCPPAFSSPCWPWSIRATAIWPCCSKPLAPSGPPSSP